MKKPRVKKSIEIRSYIDPHIKVRVYRNLHNNCFSVKQNGIVRCHADSVTLHDCKFVISKAGQKRVRDEERKNVHAFVEGWVVDTSKADHVVDGTKSDEEINQGKSEWKKLFYNPYLCDGFVRDDEFNWKKPSIAARAYFVNMSNEDFVPYAYDIVYNIN